MDRSTVTKFINYSTSDRRAKLKMTEIINDIFKKATKSNLTIKEYVDENNILTKFLYYYCNIHIPNSEYVVVDRFHSFITIMSFVKLFLAFDVLTNIPYKKQTPQKIVQQLISEYEDEYEQYKPNYEEQYSEYVTFTKIYDLF